MSIRIMSLIWSEHNGFLTSSEKAVLLRLADFAADDGSSIYPSFGTISKDTSISRRHIIKIIDELVKKDFLQKTNRERDGYNMTNLYKINVNRLNEIVSTVRQGSITSAPRVVPPVHPIHHIDPSLIHQDNKYVELVKKIDPTIQLTNEQIVNLYKKPVELIPSKGPKKSESINAIFNHWKTIMGHPKATLDIKRKKAIEKGFGLFAADDLMKAIDGCSKTPHNMGDNDTGQRYDGLHIIFKDADQIERFMRNSDKPPKPRKVFESKEDRNRQALNAQKEYRAQLMARIEKNGGLNVNPVRKQIT